MPVEPTTAARLRKLAKRIDADRAERDLLIVEAHARGASLREIAAAVGMSHVAVKKIVDKT